MSAIPVLDADDLMSAVVDPHEFDDVDALDETVRLQPPAGGPTEEDEDGAGDAGASVEQSGDASSEKHAQPVDAFSESEIKYFKKMFDLFDTDKSGAIGFYEMKNLSKHLGVQLSDELLEKSMRAIDENGTSELEFDEFLHWLSNVNSSKSDEFAVLKSKIRAQGARPLTNAQIEQLREVFIHFDADGSGTIDVDELGNVFESMGQTLSQQELESLMKQADDDGSGEIDFDEFLMLMCTSFGATHSFDGDLLAAFRKFDPDQCGMISLDDLRLMIRHLVGSEALSETELDEIVNVAHERGDGFVEYLKWDALWDACRGLNVG